MKDQVEYVLGRRDGFDVFGDEYERILQNFWYYGRGYTAGPSKHLTREYEVL